MAATFSVNQTPATGSVAMYQLIAALLTAGWTQKGSGDASTFSNAGVGPVASGAAGATGLGNTGAWVRLRAPAVTFAGSTQTREIVIQRGANDTLWWIRYSYTGAFTGGTPSATVAPTATDQVNVLGTSSAGATLFGTNNTYRCNVMAGDVSYSYGFYLFTFSTGGAATARAAFVMDPIQNPFPADKDPYLFYTSTLGANALNGQVAGGANDFYKDTANMFGFMSASVLNSTTWQTLQSGIFLQSQANVALVPSGIPVDSFGGADSIWPIYYGRRSNLSAPNGPKGFGTIMQYTGTSRANGDTLSVASVGAKDYIVCGDIVFPWNGSTPTV